MLAGLCRECHHSATVDPAGRIARYLQMEAVKRAAQDFTVPAACLVGSGPISAARYIERHLLERGEMDALREAAGIAPATA
jgi:hypothetical protein